MEKGKGESEKRMAHNKLKTLGDKESLFCWYYAAAQNGKEAAIKAGYGTLFAEKTAARLLQCEAVQVRVAELCEQEQCRKNVRKGLERLAFGSICDAVTLLCAEDLSALDAASLDLFSVAELKRPKGGGFEMKFYDRLKALESLATLEQKGGTELARPFYSAIERGAQAVCGIGETDSKTAGDN